MAPRDHEATPRAAQFPGTSLSATELPGLGPPTAAAPDFFSFQVREARRFYLDLAPPADRPLAIVSGGCEHCAGDYAIDRATFPYYSIELVVRGRGGLVLAGKPYTLLPGALFAYGPGVPQHITTSATEPLVKYFVDFTGPRAGELLSQFGPPLGTVVQVLAPAEIQAVMDDLIGNGQRAGPHAARLCALLLEYLIVKIADSRMPWEATPTPAFATYQRCRRHVETHFVRLRSVAQAARECHVDQAYFCRLFRRYAQQPPHQFLLRLKMNLAAQRLHDPAILIKQVAGELGFADPFHFSRAFKRALGISPDAFRRLR